MKRIVLALIKIYQRQFLPHRLYLRCKYFPSCSEYAATVVEKYGVFYGLPKAIWRVLRCNPFSKGGVDLP